MAYILGLARTSLKEVGKELANRRGFTPTLQLNLILLFNIVAPATFFVTAARVVRHEWYSQSRWPCTRSLANRANHRLLYMCGALIILFELCETQWNCDTVCRVCLHSSIISREVRWTWWCRFPTAGFNHSKRFNVVQSVFPNSKFSCVFSKPSLQRSSSSPQFSIYGFRSRVYCMFAKKLHLRNYE